MNNPFDTTTINRFKNNAEDNFAAERPCIVDRISIGLTPGIHTYDLPKYCIQLRRVTYLGWKVYPLPHRELRQSYVSGLQQSRPYWYIFNNVGQNQIRLFPVPSLALAQSITDLWSQPAITGGFVIEFFRSPDYTASIIPPFYRDRILKNYQKYKSYGAEGQWQNMKASNYHYKKWLRHKELFTNLLDDLNNKPRNLVAAGNSQRPYGYLPPPPILPVDKFGIPVDDISG